MPHFIIDCSETIIEQQAPDDIMQAVYDAAEGPGSLPSATLKFGFVRTSISRWERAKAIFSTFLGISWKAEAPNKKPSLPERLLSD